ncbi:hypothetical protein LZP97_26915 (plasmid) [Rhodococcus sp. DMF-1]|uniref:hypothetical protein n=1 Tax=Rhodococcus sp. DMF-1 TaxID=2907624 RepID=UPI001F32840F|nr:hypothetical protein [Rhodococcus sp. DMF-1]UIR39818.1 hypothetical protein LZP97_26915 [Rhodococcus sp. DMF-1]
MLIPQRGRELDLLDSRTHDEHPGHELPHQPEVGEVSELLGDISGIRGDGHRAEDTGRGDDHTVDDAVRVVAFESVLDDLRRDDRQIGIREQSAPLDLAALEPHPGSAAATVNFVPTAAVRITGPVHASCSPRQTLSRCTHGSTSRATWSVATTAVDATDTDRDSRVHSTRAVSDAGISASNTPA